MAICSWLSLDRAVAEFERSMLKERVHAGLVRARAQGKRLGRVRAPGANPANGRSDSAFGQSILRQRAEALIMP